MKPIEKLLWVMQRLRAPDGCAWDREQDHRTLKAYLLEETHEVLEAIDSGQVAPLQEELGDVLLHIVFHSRLAEEKGWFDFDGVADRVARKLIERHPHIFDEGGERAKDAADAVHRWEQIKKKTSSKKSVLDGVPETLPSLLKAYRVQEKASIVGFDWKDRKDVQKKVEEEVREFQQALDADRPAEEVEEEFGDLLFSLVNLSRFLKLNAEFCLERSTRKFVSRFKQIEEAARQKGTSLDKMNLEQMDELWEQVKAQGRQPEQK